MSSIFTIRWSPLMAKGEVVSLIVCSMFGGLCCARDGWLVGWLNSSGVMRGKNLSPKTRIKKPSNINVFYILWYSDVAIRFGSMKTLTYVCLVGHLYVMCKWSVWFMMVWFRRLFVQMNKTKRPNKNIIKTKQTLNNTTNLRGRPREGQTTPFSLPQSDKLM